MSKIISIVALMKVMKLLALTVFLIPLGADAGDQVRTEGTLVEEPVRVEDSWLGKGTTTGVNA